MVDDTPKDEQKTERFNMFISPSELKAIEEWAWANRIRSKSEAVRLLVQIGLLFDREADAVAADFHDLTEFFSNKSIATLEKLEDDTDDAKLQFVRDTFDLTIETEERLSYLGNRLNMLFKPYLAIRSGESFEAIKYHMLSSQADALAAALQNKAEIFELKKRYGRLPKPESDDE